VQESCEWSAIMSTTVEHLKTVLAGLTTEERFELARFLVDSIDPGESSDVEAAWEDELARRAEEIYSGTVSGKPAPLVFAQLRETHE